MEACELKITGPSESKGGGKGSAAVAQCVCYLAICCIVSYLTSIQR